MSTAADLEERVAALETQYAQLMQIVGQSPPSRAWRTVVGMFADDPDIEELHKEAERIRNDDRAATHDAE